MRVCTFRLPGELQEGARVGMFTENGVAEVHEKLTMQELLDKGPRAWKGLRAGSKLRDPRRLVLHAPLPRPRKILAAIVNTKAMLGGADVTMERPRIDMKAPSSVIAPDQRILAPPSGVRPEVELAAIIGRIVSRANVSESKKSIFG
jgi:2-keto-4-pentenoate hydratase/2-oxohepta-3-ene-1,7-dioic acid hydratase in catechol pathway